MYAGLRKNSNVHGFLHSVYPCNTPYVPQSISFYICYVLHHFPSLPKPARNAMEERVRIKKQHFHSLWFCDYPAKEKRDRQFLDMPTLHIKQNVVEYSTWSHSGVECHTEVLTHPFFIGIISDLL
jgi:hypothetical protein